MFDVLATIGFRVLAVTLLFFPLAYTTPLGASLGYKLDNIIFPAVGLLLLMLAQACLWWRGRINRSDGRSATFVAVGALCFFLMSEVSEYPKPTVFWLYSLSLVIFNASCGPLTWRAGGSLSPGLRTLFWVALLAATLAEVFNTGSVYREFGRVSGAFPSPTVFSVWMLTIYILVFVDDRYERKKYEKLVALGLVFGLTLLAGTRLSIVFLGLLFAEAIGIVPLAKMHYRYYFVGLCVAIGMMPFVYGHVNGFSDGGAFMHSVLPRQEMLASNQTRLALAREVVGHIGAPLDVSFIFGEGGGSARRLVVGRFGADLGAHNDLLAILIDFGALGLLLYLSMIYVLSMHSKRGRLLGLLLLTGFLHNMAYSYFLVTALVLSHMMSRWSLAGHWCYIGNCGKGCARS